MLKQQCATWLQLQQEVGFTCKSSACYAMRKESEYVHYQCNYCVIIKILLKNVKTFRQQQFKELQPGSAVYLFEEQLIKTKRVPDIVLCYILYKECKIANWDICIDIGV
eukprot:NODE_556_length_6708_cov_0.674837.p6 type:complete len:109 gc:universal NODE_556_length_6708_cov_0.674837:2720-3046(+)